ncbi:MAG: hypothetical protein WC389_19330 [Lutibacter sp.]|jgi:hypothetical protein
MLRDKYRCKLCHAKKNLEIHHLDCDKKNNSPSNLITICNQDHKFLHGKYTNKELREADIFDLMPKYLFTAYGKRIIDNFINQRYLEKVKEKTKLKKTKRFFRNKKSL